MKIRLAEKSDIKILSTYDKHIRITELESSISLGRVIVAEDNETLIGWLRWNLFWDNTPFMNLLYVLEEYRGKGVGKELAAFWEGEMARRGFGVFMTSTQSDEYAQHFYRKLGYRDVGGFQFPGESFELIFVKEKKDDSL